MARAERSYRAALPASRSIGRKASAPKQQVEQVRSRKCALSLFRCFKWKSSACAAQPIGAAGVAQLYGGHCGRGKHGRPSWQRERDHIDIAPHSSTFDTIRSDNDTPMRARQLTPRLS